MIAIADEKGRFLRALADSNSGIQGEREPDEREIGLHQTFGWISEQGARARERNRRRHGLLPRSEDAWQARCSVLRGPDGAIALRPIAGCKAEPAENGAWRVEVGSKQYLFVPGEAAPAAVAGREAPRGNRFEAAAILLTLLVLATALLTRKPPQKEEVASFEEPVEVKILPPERAVVIPPTQQVQVEQRVEKPVPTQQKASNLIKSKVGFLSLLGRKDLSKAVGGAPTEIRDASPGAGAGGNAGSGGELLSGLGAGIRKTTVGNTGVAGLGGVGTKGRGGGAGGYGDVTLSGGAGGKISSGSLGQDVVLEGGLSQAVIQATIAKYLSQVRACYEDGLKNNPGLTGLVNSAFEISGSGTVAKVQLGPSSLGDAGVEGCIRTRIQTWLFPKPVGGVRVKVNYPFLLKPAQG